MKIKLSIIIIVFNLTITAQVHQFGAGIGQGEGIDKLKYEGFYSFNYKLVYSKLNYIYTPNKTYHYKNTSQTILLLGIQSHSDYKLIGHMGLGARAYFPTSDNSIPLESQDKSQVNLFFNTGASFEFIKHNCLYFNLYFGKVKRVVHYKNYTDTQKYLDLMITFGYAFTFKNKRKQENNAK